MLFRKTRKISTALLCGVAAVLGACNGIPDNNAPQVGAGDAMAFEFVMPDGESTRAKTAFSTNDRIYVTAAVSLIGGTTEQRSTVMTYSASGWVPATGETLLTWPEGAVSATFTAYYLPAITVGAGEQKPVITKEAQTAIHFNTLRESTDDPLMAVREDVRLNGVVRLQFRHMMTKLAFTGLKSVPESTLTKEVSLVNTNTVFTFHNRIIFEYDSQTGYTHRFEADGSNAVTQPIAHNASQAYFLLHVDSGQWSNYMDGFYVRMNEEGKTDYILETWLNDVNLYTMQAGRHYRIYFLDSVVNTQLEAEEAWYENRSGEEKKFETADEIAAYFAGLGSGGLTQDLDFDNIPLDGIPFGTRSGAATRSLTLTNNFNGNHYTIRNVNVGNGLFASIPPGCTVQNLRLENVKVQADGASTTAAGLLAPVNEGTISNVRISGANVLGAADVPYVGGLVGLNKGTIRDVQMTGAVTIDAVCGDDLTAGGLYVGGVVGANGLEKPGTYTVSNTILDAACIIRVAGRLDDKDIHAGGFAGFNAPAKRITGCSASAEINASGAFGENCYTGGFAGVNRGTLSSCDASGRVVGGMSETTSATGGFVGYATSGTETAAAYLASLNGCIATGSVHETYSDGNLRSYIGGFCGFCEIDAINIASAGTIYPVSGGSTERKAGAVAGVISSDKTITNSFSMCTPAETLNFCGVECKTINCHFGGKLVDESGHPTSTDATAVMMNNASKSGYREWKSTSGVYGGAPYFNK